MKIVYPYPTYWPYVRRGVERCIHDLANFLAKRGHEVDIITSKPGRTRVAFDGLARVIYLGQFSHPLVYKYWRFSRLYAFGVAATSMLLRQQYDVAHLWAYSSIVAAPLLRTWRRLPYIYHLMLRKHFWPGRFDEWAFRRLMRHANRVAALTPGGAAEAAREFGVDAIALSPPVDTEAFFPCADKDLARPRILFTGDLGDARKGGPLLLRAWDEIHRRCPEAVLVLAGPFGIVGYDTRFGVYTLEHLNLIRSPSAREAIEIPGSGPVEALPRQYSQAAVTVLPSVEEAFGMVVTESLACGTPVVCSAYDGPGEIVTSPDVGVTLPLKTQADLMSQQAAQQVAEGVLRAIELARKPKTSERCRAWVEPWSLERVGPAVERVLVEAASDYRGALAGRDVREVAVR